MFPEQGRRAPNLLCGFPTSLTVEGEQRARVHSAARHHLTKLSREDGGRSFLLHLETPHPPAEAALRALDGVTDITAQDGAGYRVTFDPERTENNAILRAVIESQGRIVAVQEDSSQLNQAFMDLTEPGVPQ